MTASEPSDVAARPTHVTETLVADFAVGSAPVDKEADRAVTELYSTHYRSLVRLAALLVRDIGTAEEVVQDSFVAMHGGWRRLRDSDKALSYLRQSVVNRSRSVLRHRVVVDRNAPKPAPDMPSAKPWCYGSMPICPKRRSPTRCRSAAARSRVTRRGRCRRSAPSWSVTYEHAQRARGRPAPGPACGRGRHRAGDGWPGADPGQARQAPPIRARLGRGGVDRRAVARSTWMAVCGGLAWECRPPCLGSFWPDARAA